MWHHFLFRYVFLFPNSIVSIFAILNYHSLTQFLLYQCETCTSHITKQCHPHILLWRAYFMQQFFVELCIAYTFAFSVQIGNFQTASHFYTLKKFERIYTDLEHLVFALPFLFRKMVEKPIEV